MKNILMYGLSSFKNKGCEAIVKSTLDQTEKIFNKPVIATFDINYNSNFFVNKVKYIKQYLKEDELTLKEKQLNEYYKSIPFNYNNFELLYQRNVVNEIKKSDIVLAIGGDNYCYGYNEWLYALNKEIKKQNKTLILWGASLFDEINNLELIEDLKKYDLLIIRESLSYNAIKKYIDESKILYAPDPAFSLKTERIKLNSWYKNRKILGINLSPLTISKDNNSFDEVCEFIDYVLKNTEYSICLLPHVVVDDCNDLDILKEIKEKYKDNDKVYLEKNNYNCSELKYIISTFEMLLAARTHASIAAYSSCVPTLVLGYSVKSKGIAKDIFGTYEEYVLPKNEISKENLINKFNYINENKNKIKNHLQKIMPKMIEKSSNILEESLKRIRQNNKSIVCAKEKCSGCSACLNICPKNAITMKENDEGFLYPEINQEKCINCGLCRKICPSLNKQINNYKKECYGFINKNTLIQKESSSGGVFTALAEEVLKNNGIVYGATKDNSQNIYHIKITNIKDLQKIRGSKYVQSNLKSLFQEIKQKIQAGGDNLILFSGTPCQINGLKLFLGKDYNNLITISVVCHGVLSSKILKKYLKEIEENNNQKITDVKFKSKRNGWHNSSIEYIFNKDSIVNKFIDDPLMWLYLNNYILRESCYQCSCKGKNNLADIIIADFWGVEIKYPNYFDNNGVSAIIINSEKGKNLFEKIKEKNCVFSASLKNIKEYNPMIFKSASKPFERNCIFNNLEKNSFRIMKELYNSKEKIKSLKKECTELTEKNTSINIEKEKLKNEKDLIVNSKRWRILNKILLIKDKLTRRKK